MAEGKTYEPGPSFVDDDRPVERLTEMPAWLQSFAAQESQSDEEAVTGEDSLPDMSEHLPAPDLHEETESSLPDWLRSGSVEEITEFELPEDAPEPNMLASFVDDSSNPDGFISEDDLPDWLRAFSDESPVPAPSAPPVAPVRAAAPDGAAVVRVPPVENIWLSAYDRQALGPGGTLFALLASNNGSDASREYDTTTTYSAADTTSHSPGAVSGKPAKAPAGESQEAQAAPSSSMRLILLTLLVVLLVVAVSFWQFS